MLDIIFSYRCQIRTDDTIVPLSISMMKRRRNCTPQLRIYLKQALDVLTANSGKTIVFDLSRFDDESIPEPEKIDEKGRHQFDHEPLGYLKKDLEEVLAQVERSRRRAISLQELESGCLSTGGV